MGQPVQGPNPWTLLAAGAHVDFGAAGENCDIRNNSGRSIEYRVSLPDLAGRIELVVRNAFGQQASAPVRTDQEVYHHFILPMVAEGDEFFVEYN